MKNIKIFLLLIFMFVLSGCATTYELNINGNKFNEKITTYIYEGDRETAVFDDGATASRIDAFVEYDVYPYFENYEKVYDKTVNKIENYEEVILKYKFKDTEYKNSNAINLCFENRKFEITKDYYNIDLTGYFYCLYDNKVFDIEIKTNNKVINHNADEKIGNKYVWHINDSNYKNVDVKIKLEKDNPRSMMYTILLSIGVIILIASILVFVKNKIKKNNSF